MKSRRWRDQVSAVHHVTGLWAPHSSKTWLDYRTMPRAEVSSRLMRAVCAASISGASRRRQWQDRSRCMGILMDHFFKLDSILLIIHSLIRPTTDCTSTLCRLPQVPVIQFVRCRYLALHPRLRRQQQRLPLQLCPRRLYLRRLYLRLRPQ